MKNFIEKTKLRFLVTIIAMISVSCFKGETDDSESKDLVNFSKTDDQQLIVNKCGPEVPLDHIPAASIEADHEVQKTAVRQALSAAPTMMAKFFFDELKGKVIVKANISPEKDCPNLSDLEKKFYSEDSGSLKSCWSKAQGKGPVVIVQDGPDDNQKHIHHSMVRTMALVFTGVGVEGFAKSNDIKKKDFAEKFYRSIRSFSELYVKALEKRKNSEEDKEKAVKFDAVVSKMRTLQDQGKKDSIFAKMVYAEMIDSLYCSQDTFAGLQKEESFKPLLGEFRNLGLLGANGEMNCPWYMKAEQCSKEFCC